VDFTEITATVGVGDVIGEIRISCVGETTEVSGLSTGIKLGGLLGISSIVGVGEVTGVTKVEEVTGTVGAVEVTGTAEGETLKAIETVGDFTRATE
jgi:hypothetical protein